MLARGPDRCDAGRAARSRSDRLPFRRRSPHLPRGSVPGARNGLDFIAITDHNTTSHYDAIRELQPYFDRLLVIRGREITTFQGHANVYGTTEFLDFRVGSPLVPTMNNLLQRVQSLHALFSINHPNDPSGEACMGCRWTAADANFGLIQAVEAVSDGNGEGPLSGIPFWEAQLNRGFHLTGMGGSDTHRPDESGKPRSGVGYPTTVVMASELSEPAILDGIRAGHVFIDLEGTRDRRLEFSGTSGGKTARMGDTLEAPSGGTIHFTVRATHGSGARIEAIEDGRAVLLAAESFDRTSDGRRHWIRINLRDEAGRLLLVGNPIYY